MKVYRFAKRFCEFTGVKFVNVTKESKIKAEDLEEYNRSRTRTDAIEFYKKKAMVQ